MSRCVGSTGSPLLGSDGYAISAREIVLPTGGHDAYRRSESGGAPEASGSLRNRGKHNGGGHADERPPRVPPPRTSQWFPGERARGTHGAEDVVCVGARESPSVDAGGENANRATNAATTVPQTQIAPTRSRACGPPPVAAWSLRRYTATAAAVATSRIRTAVPSICSVIAGPSEDRGLPAGVR